MENKKGEGRKGVKKGWHLLLKRCGHTLCFALDSSMAGARKQNRKAKYGWKGGSIEGRMEGRVMSKMEMDNGLIWVGGGNDVIVIWW